MARLPFRACLSTATSPVLCVAKASHDFNVLSSPPSSARSTGLCSNEQDGAIHRRSPSLSLTGASASRILSRSLRQILRPSPRRTGMDNTARSRRRNNHHLSGRSLAPGCLPPFSRPRRHRTRRTTYCRTDVDYPATRRQPRRRCPTGCWPITWRIAMLPPGHWARTGYGIACTAHCAATTATNPTSRISRTPPRQLLSARSATSKLWIKAELTVDKN